MKLRKKLDCILLVDDDPDDNLFHDIIIREMDIVHHIAMAMNGLDALSYLESAHGLPPDLIFLDINMPRMNGWEFLEAYEKLDPGKKAKTLIMMLTTSANPDDLRRAQEMETVTGFQTKPLSREMLTDILREHFSEYLAN